MAATTKPAPPDAGRPSLLSRLGWFFGLAVAGGLSTAIVAYGLRFLLLH
jgi:hypothetical protein